MAARRERVLGFSHYLAATREPRFSILVVVALLAVYELGMLATGSRVRNAADLVLKDLLGRLSPHGETAFHAFLLVVFALAAVSLARSQGSVLRFLLPFLAESLAWAMLLSPAVLLLREPFLAAPRTAESLLLDLGAGVYEEIVFRFAIIRLGLLAFRLDPWHAFFAENSAEPTRALQLAGPLFVVFLASALGFSAYHHVGSGGEHFDAGVFVFRALAGFLLAAIYLFRGLGVAVYAHALYDVLVHFASS